MKTYAIHTKRVVTQDLEDMLATYPTPAEYGECYLFAQPHPSPQNPVVDLRGIEDLAEFEAEFARVAAEEHTGRWLYLTEAQGRHITKPFNQDEEGGV